MSCNMYKNIIYITFFVVAFAIPGVADAWGSRDVDAGLASLRAGRLEDAEAAFRRARFDDPVDPRIAYDLGIVAYHERRFDEAAREFEHVASSSASEPGLVADAFHNLGNARFQAGEYLQAVEAYQAALARRDDPETQYNLDQARKRLAEQQAAQERQQNEQQGAGQQQSGQQQQQQPGQKNQGQQQQGQQQQGQEGQQGGRQSGEEGDNKQQGQERGQNGSQQQNQEPGRPSGNASDTKEQPSQRAEQEPASGTSKPEEQRDQRQANASDSQKQPEDAAASESASWSEQEAKQRDVKLDPGTQSAKDIPDVSQRARAMKNQKLNAYMVERLLRQMEEREKEIQRRYRRDPSDRDRDSPFDDPFFMDPDQMREFMEGRRGKPRKPEGETPDW